MKVLMCHSSIFQSSLTDWTSLHCDYICYHPVTVLMPTLIPISSPHHFRCFIYFYIISLLSLRVARKQTIRIKMYQDSLLLANFPLLFNIEKDFIFLWPDLLLYICIPSQAHRNKWNWSYYDYYCCLHYLLLSVFPGDIEWSWFYNCNHYFVDRIASRSHSFSLLKIFTARASWREKFSAARWRAGFSLGGWGELFWEIGINFRDLREQLS